VVDLLGRPATSPAPLLTRPGWAALMAGTGRRRSGLASRLAWLHAHGLLTAVDHGSAAGIRMLPPPPGTGHCRTTIYPAHHSVGSARGAHIRREVNAGSNPRVRPTRAPSRLVADSARSGWWPAPGRAGRRRHRHGRRSAVRDAGAAVTVAVASCADTRVDDAGVSGCCGRAARGAGGPADHRRPLSAGHSQPAALSSRASRVVPGSLAVAPSVPMYAGVGTAADRDVLRRRRRERVPPAARSGTATSSTRSSRSCWSRPRCTSWWCCRSAS